MEVDFDEETAAVLKRRAVEHGFKSPQAYVETLVVTVLAELEDTGDDQTTIEDRLRDLGYL